MKERKILTKLLKGGIGDIAAEEAADIGSPPGDALDAHIKACL